MGGGGESWIEMPSGNLHHQDQGYMDPGDRSQVQWHGTFHDHNFNFNFNVDLNRVPGQHHPGAGEEAMAPEHLFVLPDPDGTDGIYELDELDPLQFLPPAQHGLTHDGDLDDNFGLGPLTLPNVNTLPNVRTNKLGDIGPLSLQDGGLEQHPADLVCFPPSPLPLSSLPPGEGKSVGPFSHPLLMSFDQDGGKATGSGVPLLPLGSRTVADASSRQVTRQPLPALSSAGPSWLPPKPPARSDREVDEAELRLLEEQHRAYLTPACRRKGKGGRQPAGDPRDIPGMCPRKARRILANRLSAAKSKLKQKTHVEELRMKVQTMKVEKSALQEAIRHCEHVVEQKQDEKRMIIRSLTSFQADYKILKDRNSSLSDQLGTLGTTFGDLGLSDAQVHGLPMAPVAAAGNGAAYGQHVLHNFPNPGGLPPGGLHG